MMPEATHTRPTTEDRIRAALWFAERGFGVFTVWSADEHGICRCPAGKVCLQAGKHPIMAHGFHDATNDPDRIRTLLSAGSQPNYGLVCPEGVFALDVDGEGVAALAELEQNLGALPDTLRTETAHGQHIFLRWPPDLPRPLGQLFGYVTRWGSGRDAGYVIGPRSVHASGFEYSPSGSFEIEQIPETWARAALEARAKPPALVVSAGTYQLPESVAATESRYGAIRTYVAHLYNTGLQPIEMWPLVRDILAPRFAAPLEERELRGRFDRTVANMGQRLGDRRIPGARVEEPQGPLEDGALTEYDSTPIEWLWEAWLPRGVVTLMDGNPGVSKSTLVADLVARITTGRPWPDESPMPAGSNRAMWITTEDDPGRVLRPRIEAAGGNCALVRFVKSEVVFPSGAEAFKELVCRRAAEPAGLALVILDPLFSHIDATVRTIADAEMRKGVMNPLAEAAEAAGVAILVVRHFSKDSTASAINRGAGSLGGIVGAARALWSVILDPEDETGETKAVGVAKLNYARPHAALRYHVVDRLPPGWVSGSVSGVEWLGESPVNVSSMMSEAPDVHDAVAALEEILAAGSLPSAAAESRMKSRGFGKAATKGAKKRLGVVSSKLGMAGGWSWCLPTMREEVEGVGRDSFEEVEEVFDVTPSTPSEPRAPAHTRETIPPSTPSTPSGPDRPLRAESEIDPDSAGGNFQSIKRERGNPFGSGDPFEEVEEVEGAEGVPGSCARPREADPLPVFFSAKRRTGSRSARVVGSGQCPVCGRDTNVEWDQASQTYRMKQHAGEGGRCAGSGIGAVERPASTWLRPCSDYADHQQSHRQTSEGWVCDACQPEEMS